MSLFERLQKNSAPEAQEDFFTKVVASLFESSPDLLFSWLKHIGLALDTQSYQIMRVKTQVSLPPLTNHDMGARPDITIKLSDGHDQRDVIFIESKIGTLEHDNQLQRYADQLAASYPNAGQRILLYITRDLEPKDENYILENVHPPSQVTFKQLFWYEFCQFLQKQPFNTLITEVTCFMKIKGMALDPKATEYSVVAASGMSRSIMDWTLRSNVQAKFAQAFGPVTPLQLFAGEESRLRQWGEYCLYCGLDQERTWSCGLGYQLKNPCAAEADESKLRMILLIAPNSPHRLPIIKAMKAISQGSDWHGIDLELSAWSGITRDYGLTDFLPMEKHIGEIQAQLLRMVDELIDIRRQYPGLPWNAANFTV